MALADHVTLTITADSVGVSRAGFGVPLILSATAAFAERTRVYTDLSGLVADGFAAGSPEHRAASAMFAQAPRPPKVKIGRSALPPTLVYTLNVVTVRDLHTYKLNVRVGNTTTEVEFTSDGTATDGEIVVGLTAAIDAVAANNYATAGVTSPFTVTADAAGDWFSIESPDITDVDIKQTHADPGVATDLAAIQLADPDWYALYTLFNSEAYAGAAATWINSEKKIYLADTNDSESISTATGNGELMDDIFVQQYARTMGAYHPDSSEMFGAAWLGRMLPLDPGSATWKFKSLSGISVTPMSATSRANLIGKNGNSYETSGGVNHTFEGTVGDGDFMDNQRGDDWLEDDMSAEVLETLLNAPKVPFTDAGVAQIQGAVEASLKRAFRRTIITDDFVVTVPLVADVSNANKTARTLPDVKFTATRQGAIHKTIITGVISV